MKLPGSNSKQANSAAPSTAGLLAVAKIEVDVDPGYEAGTDKGYRSDMSVSKGPGQKVGGSS